MAYLTHEGTKDFLLGSPAIVLTFKASGSITGGKVVTFDAGNTADVYVASGNSVGQISVLGVALKTVSDDDPVPVLIWGVAKNLAMENSSETVYPGSNISVSGSGGFTSGSEYCIGRVISGSATRFVALIDGMRCYTAD